MYVFYTNHHNRTLLAALLMLVGFMPIMVQANFRMEPDDCQPLPPHDSALGEALTAFDNTVGDDFWQSDQRLRALMAQLQTLEDDGLEPDHYFLPVLEAIRQFHATWGVVLPCDADLASYAYLSALADLRFGRQETQETEQIWYAPMLGERRRGTELNALASLGQDNLALAFEQARPELDRYAHLRDAYITAREHLPESWPVIPGGDTLEVGMQSSRVGLLRQRLSAEHYLPETGDTSSDADTGPETNNLFDASLSLAIEEFQRRHYLDVDGKVGAQTLEQLNIQPAERLEQIRANLERLRRLAADMEETLLLVDIAAAKLEFYRKGELAWSGRAQVGRPLRQTPKLKSVITHITVNPSWTIPTSIFVRDQLPRIRRNPDYLNQRNISIYNNRGEELAMSEVNWSNPRGILLRQAPGPNNALGEVVIRFSNPFAVYLHDTPTAWLFNTNNRFYSSGCVRVEDAMTLAQALFEASSPQAWQAVEQVRASGASQNVHLPRSVPVLLAYWTVEADPDGVLRYRPDPYRDDPELLAGLSQD
ncbi:L,D-transpeptidase family protein [Marinobacter mobilis]|uniref:Murein L,D-transpeptidase YcbB/YkuD n=1 Tax=Marinobacter mobilis TaxID=488533 RepID=A0A1H2SWY0_9GAMM|nr:L,D-transpeptidase family protein [Marinobacter mobilis]SDW35539.1 Murein L,D-transpeptidase YcbB/YkuD [Marinobacter mobilis]